MAITEQEALAELYRRGALKGQQKAAFEELVRRGEIKDNSSRALVDARARVGRSTNGQMRAFTQGVTMGFADELDAFGAGVETAVGNIGRSLMGKELPYTPQEAEQAVLQANREADKQFSQEHPFQSIGLNIAGGIATPGGAAAGRFVTAGRNLPAVIGRSAAVGAGMGAVGGAGAAEGGFADRLAGAGKGAVVGAAVGGAIPVAGRVAQSAGNAAAGVGTTVARAANRLSGGRLLNADQTAARRLSEALRADGIDQATAARAVQEWQQTGSLPPSLMDVAGRNTRRLIRAAAAPGGEAENIAQQYSNRTTANLQDNATRLAEGLTPYEARPVGRYVDAIEGARDVTARTDYAEPYSQVVNITPEVSSALSGRSGEAAISRALKAAEARRDVTQIAELSDLQRAVRNRAAVDPNRMENAFDLTRPNIRPLPPVSGATLDRLQIALREMSDNAGSNLVNRQRDVAAGLSGRRANINDSLDAFEGLADARSAYRSFSQNAEAAQLGANNPFSSPSTFADELGAITGENPMARLSAGVGVRSSIVEGIGAPAANATGYLNRLSSGTNAGDVLTTTFGQETADRFRQGIGNEVSRVQNARFIDPTTNSQTASRAMDESLVSGGNLPRSISGVVLSLIDRVRTGATLTDAERAAIVRLGSGDATAGLNTLEALAAGRPADPRVAAILAQIGNASAGVSGQRSAAPAVFIESIGNQQFDQYGQPINR